jgi:hypothetical protein
MMVPTNIIWFCFFWRVGGGGGGLRILVKERDIIQFNLSCLLDSYVVAIWWVLRTILCIFFFFFF